MKHIMETYLSILNHFTSKSSSVSRDWMTTAFVANDRAIATDAMKLVSTPIVPNLHDYAEKVKNVYPVTPNMDKLIPLSELMEKINAWPQVDCFDDIKEKCDACDGNGQVEYTFYYKLEPFETCSECPICDGEGLILGVSKTPNGKKEPDTEVLFRIGNSAFPYDFVKSLLFVAETLQSDIRVLRQIDNSSPTLFSIGEVEVLLMPTYGYDEKKIAQNIEL